MLAGKWPRRFVVLTLVLSATWILSGKLLMEFEWTPMSRDAAAVERLRHEAAEGLAYNPINGPCMMQTATVDLDLWLDGPFPIGAGREIVMEVTITNDILLSPRVYVGPPIRRLELRGLPVCVPDVRIPPGSTDADAFAYIDIQFLDLAGRQYLNFGGDDPFPVFAWRQMRVDWSMVPWLIAKTATASRIMVTPL
jgi:hypothetical protein